MSFFSSLYSSASGLYSFDKGTAVVSQNIANVSTVGYKSSSISFRDAVYGSRSQTSSTLAGVRPTRLLNANLDGSVQQTSSRTDAAIQGRGFFPVKQTLLSEDDFYFTRNGQFNEYAIRSTPDSQALVQERVGESTYLRNSAGYYLYGWALDQNGTATSGTDLNSLVPIDVGIFETQALPTSQIDFSMNLDAGETGYDPHAFSTASQLPVSGRDTHFSRSVSVFDANGAERRVTFEFRKVIGPMAHFRSDTLIPMERTDSLIGGESTPGLLDGSTFNIDNGVEQLDIVIVAGAADISANEASTVQDLLEVINNFDPGTGRVYDAHLDNGQLVVQSIDPTLTLDISTNSDPEILGTTGLNFVQDPDTPGDYIYEPDFDITSAAGTAPYTTQDSFPAFFQCDQPEHARLVGGDGEDPRSGESERLHPDADPSGIDEF